MVSDFLASQEAKGLDASGGHASIVIAMASSSDFDPQGTVKELTGDGSVMGQNLQTPAPGEVIPLTFESPQTNESYVDAPTNSNLIDITAIVGSPFLSVKSSKRGLLS